MTVSKIIFSSRKTRVFMFLVIVVSFIFLISTNYSVYVKTKAYEIYIQIDKSSFKSSSDTDSIKISNVLPPAVPPIAIAAMPKDEKTNSSDNYLDDKQKESIFSMLNSTYQKHTNASELCSIIPPHLTKNSFKISDLRAKVNTTVLGFDVIENMFQNLSLTNGGQWSPKSCKSRHRVAIVVPYRDRESNLKVFLHHMHPFLMRQQLDYGLFIVEPAKGLTFNRGMLMNIGYIEALKMSRNSENKTHWQCFAFHDCDLLPEDERNLYSCPEQPRHMSSSVSTFNYKLPYDTLFGGVTMFSNAQYEKVNGFSNLFFGWGGEDDDLANRILYSKFKIARYPLEIGRYTMASHQKDRPNEERHKFLDQGYKRMNKDGLSSLKYTITKIEKTLLYTKIHVYYNETEIRNQTL